MSITHTSIPVNTSNQIDIYCYTYCKSRSLVNSRASIESSVVLVAHLNKSYHISMAANNLKQATKDSPYIAQDYQLLD